MSKFNHYARELNEIATEAFNAFKKAEKRLNEATAAKSKFNRYSGNVTFSTEYARANADYLEAKGAYNAAKKGLLAAGNEKIKTLRSKLVADIEAENMANPAQLDSATLELLKSGILSANEYEHLLDQAKSANNHTMVRMIGKYAGDAAEKTADREQAANLKSIAYNSRSASYADRVQGFDMMIDVMNRAANNSAMIDQWEGLTADIISDF